MPREPIIKNKPNTLAEDYLKKFCDQTFLSLWSYPSVFRDEGIVGEKGDGKEVCDLLVVFGHHIIIFSDKSCVFPDTDKTELGWSRWFRKAIFRSARQAWGAERWIRNHPDRIYTDKACKQRLPINVSNSPDVKYHLVVVAHGVSESIRKFFNGGTGSLMIDTTVQGSDHSTRPFTIGDLNPKRTFVHVLDDTSLPLIMNSRDTVNDFVSYLGKREELLRGRTKIAATGEEELLAIYLQNMNANNEHDFVFPKVNMREHDGIGIAEGFWEKFEASPERRAQKQADKISYLWDDIIESFNQNVLGGTEYFTSGELTDSERVLRFMASEPRYKRRLLAGTLIDMKRTTPDDIIRKKFLKPLIDDDPYYILLLYPLPQGDSGKTLEDYRTARSNHLLACCMVIRYLFPEALDIVGFATESGNQNEMHSEDACYFDGRKWNDSLSSQAKEFHEKYGIFKDPKITRGRVNEYPQSEDK